MFCLEVVASLYVSWCAASTKVLPRTNIMLGELLTSFFCIAIFIHSWVDSEGRAVAICGARIVLGSIHCGRNIAWHDAINEQKHSKNSFSSSEELSTVYRKRRFCRLDRGICQLNLPAPQSTSSAGVTENCSWDQASATYASCF